MFNQNHSIFAGMTTAALQAALSSAQNAYVALSSGTQAAAVTLRSGEASERSVTYRQTDLGALVRLINELQACLGLVHTPRSRPARFIFR